MSEINKDIEMEEKNEQGAKNEEILDQDQDIVQEEETPAEDEISMEEKLKEDLIKEKDKFLRLFAEFENYKKRTVKERIDLYKTANQEVLLAMLPVVDDFERGMIEINKSTDENLIKGVQLIETKFLEILKQKGLKPMETKQGDDFDVDFHEAITKIPAPSEDLKGKVIDAVEKGYMLGDKVIRYAKVVIGD